MFFLMQGYLAADYIVTSTSEETAALLAGKPPGVLVQFNKYIFDEEASQLIENLQETTECDKENSVHWQAATVQQPAPTSCRPATDFLREVEKIFLSDIVGSGDLVTAGTVLTDITPR
jgi:hypothetical protein